LELPRFESLERKVEEGFGKKKGESGRNKKN